MTTDTIEVKINDTSNGRENFKKWVDLPVLIMISVARDQNKISASSQGIVDDFAKPYGNCEARWNFKDSTQGHYKDYYAVIGQQSAPIINDKIDPFAIEL